MAHLSKIHFILDVITQKLQQQDNPLLGYPLSRWHNDADDIVIGGRLSSACYVQDAVPATMYLASKYHQDVERGLIANTNLGGGNAGRGAVLGALLGAVNGHRAFPESWIGGLTHPPTNLILNLPSRLKKISTRTPFPRRPVHLKSMRFQPTGCVKSHRCPVVQTWDPAAEPGADFPPEPPKSV